MMTTFKNLRLLLITAGLSVLLFFYPLFSLFCLLPLIYYQLKESENKKGHWVLLGLSVTLSFVFSFVFFSIQAPGLPSANEPLGGLLSTYFQSDRLLQMLFQSFVFSATYFVHAVIAIMIGRSFNHHPLEFTKNTLKNVTRLCLILLALVLVFVLWQHDTIYSEYITTMNAGFDDFIKDYEDAGFTVQQIVEIKSLFPRLVEVSFYLFPIGIVFGVWAIYFFNLIIAKSLFANKWKKLIFYTLLDFKVKFEWIWLFLISALALAAAYRFQISSLGFASIMNVVLLLAGLYLMQGLAVLFYYLNAKQIFGFSRLFVFLAFIFLPQFSFIVLFLIGLADNWKDFRIKIQESVKKEMDS